MCLIKHSKKEKVKKKSHKKSTLKKKRSVPHHNPSWLCYGILLCQCPRLKAARASLGSVFERPLTPSSYGPRAEHPVPELLFFFLYPFRFRDATLAPIPRNLDTSWPAIAKGVVEDFFFFFLISLFLYNLLYGTFSLFFLWKRSWKRGLYFLFSALVFRMLVT